MEERSAFVAGRGPVRYTLDIFPNDVLFGRGSPSYHNEGNIRLRSIVEANGRQYLATNKHDEKTKIAAEVVQIVLQREGRFLRKIETEEESAELGVPDDVDAYVIVDDTTIFRKVKQLLREQKKNFKLNSDSDTFQSSNSQLSFIKTFDPYAPLKGDSFAKSHVLDTETMLTSGSSHSGEKKRKHEQSLLGDDSQPRNRMLNVFAQQQNNNQVGTNSTRDSSQGENTTGTAVYVTPAQFGSNLNDNEGYKEGDKGRKMARDGNYFIANAAQTSLQQPAINAASGQRFSLPHAPVIAPVFLQNNIMPSQGHQYSRPFIQNDNAPQPENLVPINTGFQPNKVPGPIKQVVFLKRQDVNMGPRIGAPQYDQSLQEAQTPHHVAAPQYIQIFPQSHQPQGSNIASPQTFPPIVNQQGQLQQFHPRNWNDLHPPRATQNNSSSNYANNSTFPVNAGYFGNQGFNVQQQQPVLVLNNGNAVPTNNLPPLGLQSSLFPDTTDSQHAPTPLSAQIDLQSTFNDRDQSDCIDGGGDDDDEDDAEEEEDDDEEDEQEEDYDYEDDEYDDCSDSINDKKQPAVFS